MKINIVTIAPFESKVKRANLSTILLNLVSSFLGLHFLHLLLLVLSHFLAGVKLNKLWNSYACICVDSPDIVLGVNIVELDLIGKGGLLRKIYLKVAEFVSPSGIHAIEICTVKVNLGVGKN